MIKKVVEIDVKTSGAVDNTEDLTKSFKDLNSTIKETDESTEELGKTSKETTDGIAKGGKNAEKGTGGLSKGFKGVGLAIKAAGIGLIIGVLSTLYDVFSSNQKVVDAVSVAFETMSIIFNELFTVLSDVYNKVGESTGGFDALKNVIGGLITLALTPLKANFYGIVLAVKATQLAWEKSFLGGNDPETIKRLQKDLDETKQKLIDIKDDAIEAGKQVASNAVEAFNEVGEIVNGVTEGVKKISVSASFQLAKNNVALKNNAQLAVATQARLIEQYDRAAEKQRQIRDDEAKSIKERQEANNKLGEILNEQEESMLKLADLQIAAAQADVNKTNSIENQVKLIEALTNKDGILAQVEGFRSEQLVNQTALIREQEEVKNEAIVKEQERLTAINEINLANNEKLAEELLITEEEKVLHDAEIQLAELDALNASEEEKAKAILYWNGEVMDAQKKDREETKKAELKGLQTKLTLASQGAQVLAELAGEGTALAKAAATTGVIIDAASAIIGTWAGYASMGPLGVAGAVLQTALIAVTAASSISDINSAKPGGSVSAPPSASGLRSANAAAASEAQSPSFNLVGQGESNQIATALGDQPPVKAYVVSEEVTTNQALDRSITEEASI